MSLGLNRALILGLRPGGVSGGTPAPDLAPTTLTNSYNGTLDGQAFTIATSVPVLFTADAIGHPTMISDRAFTWSVTPAPASIPSGSFVMGTVTVSGASYPANNVQETPFFGAAGEGAADQYGTTPQGFDGMSAVYSDGNGPSDSTTQVYSAGLSAAQPIAVAIGQKRSFVIGFRKAGVTTPTGWERFGAWLRITVLDAVPPAGFFAPAASATDKTVRYTTAMRNKSVLSGRPLAAGKPDLATCIASGYVRQSIIPDFGQSGEQRRIAFAGLWSSIGYSRDSGQIFNDVLAALHAQGAAADDLTLNRMLDYAIQLEALLERGHLHMGGAGQNSGHKQIAAFGAFVFQSVSGTYSRMMSVVGSATHQHHWVRPTDAGRGTLSVFDSNHDISQRVYDSGHVGRAQYSAELPFYFATPVVNYAPGYNISRLRYDAAFPADYESVASLATFGEFVNICLLKNGLGGVDGSQALLMGGANSTANPFAASLNYFDQLRIMRADLTSDGSLFTPREAAHYDAHRDSFAVPRVGMTPADVTPDGVVPSGILSAGNGQFTWNLSGIGGDYPAATAWQIEYALPVAADLYGVQWIAVDAPAISGTQTGLPPGIKLYVRWRRQNAHGWGPWTINFPKVRAAGLGTTADKAERCTITLTGSTATAPANSVAPVIYRRTYTDYWGPLYTLVTDPAGLVVDSDLIAGRGKSTGNLSALPLIKWQRNSVDISGATAAVYRLTSADLGQNIRHGISEDGGATWTYSTPIAIAGPVYPAKTLTAFDGTNDWLSRTGAFSGAPADGKQLTIGMMLAATGSDGVSKTLLALADAAGSSGSDTIISLLRTSANRLTLTARSAANVNVFNASTASGTINVAAGELRIMISIDLATASYQFYINDTALTLGTVTGTLGDIGWSVIARPLIMAGLSGAGAMPANHRYTFIHPGKIDLSVQGNRDKFLLANIGNQGEGVFGTPALVMVYGGSTTINNYGYGGGFTLVGSVPDV